MKRHDITIGNIVKKWIEKEGITQAVIAEEMKMKRTSLNQMLNGYSPIPKPRLRWLIERLNPPEEDVKEINDIKYSIERISKSNKKEIIEQNSIYKIPLTKIKNFNPLLHSFEKFIAENQTGKHRCILDGIHNFAIKIDTDELEHIQKHSLIIVSQDDIYDKCVIASINDKIGLYKVCKYSNMEKGNIAFVNIWDDSEYIFWNLSENKNIVNWVFVAHKVVFDFDFDVDYCDRCKAKDHIQKKFK